MRTLNIKFLAKISIIVFFCFVSVKLTGQIQINDEAGLKAIADDLAGEYILVSDITLTESWTPIGDNENRFTGIIDGNGKSIHGLKFKDSSRNGAGFIGVAEGAVVKNLSIVGATIYGGQSVGGVVGLSYAPTTVENCYTSGVFSGWDHIGGIIGGSRQSDPVGEFSEVINCFSTAAVISTDHQAGGIVGAAVDLVVQDTYFAGIATCPYNRTGGIVALLDLGTAQIYNSVVFSPYLKGNVTNRILGGFNDGTTPVLINNYSWENTEVYREGVLYFDGENDPDGVDGEHSTESRLKSTSFYTTELNWNNSIWNFEEGKLPVLSFQSYPINGDAIYIPIFPERPLPGTTFESNPLSSLNRTVTTSSSDPTVATIDENGLVTFIKDGLTILTFTTQGDAEYNGATLSYELVVEGISYEISNEQDLRNIKYDLNGEYTLMNNITLTKDWELMGTFRGVLNGNGKIIYGLRYDNQDQYGVGLFGNAEGALVTKLGIEGAYIRGNGDVGAIMGNMYGSTISECYVANSYIAGRDHVGAIAGAMRSRDVEEGVKEWSVVSNCHSGAQIYSREYQAAGLVGIINGGTLENCYFSGVVQSEQGRATGIVSLVDNDDAGEVKNNINLAAGVYCAQNTYRIGDWGGRVPGEDNNYVKFINNWSASKSYFGASLNQSAMKTASYDANDREGRNLDNDNKARSQDFYVNTLGWDFNETWKFIPGTEGKMYPVLEWQEAPLVSVIYGVPNPAFLIWTPLADANIDLAKIIGSYGQELTFEITEGSQFVEREGNFLFIVEREPSTAGTTTVNMNIDPALVNVVDVLNSNLNIEIILQNTVYNIATVADFLAINDKLFGRFRLTNNIDMTGIEFYGIGSAQTPFTGQFYGDGFSILNPVVKTNGDNKKGLFNATQGARIEKLGVVNFTFSGSSTGGSGNADLGGLVGSCRSTVIDQCFLTGNLVGRDHVGAFVGGDCNDVIIRNSYADANIRSYWQAGGLFGVTAGNVTIENCYFTGTVTTQSGWAGGIIGLIDRAGEVKMSNTVSIADVSSGEKAGYHIAGNINNVGTVSLFRNNLYDFDAIINTNGEEWKVTSEIEIPGQIEYATGKLITQLKQQATYTAIGWDFDNVWTIQEGQSLPQLKHVPVVSSVPSVPQDKNNYLVYVSEDKVYISGINQSAEVSLYNINGQLVANGVFSDNAVLKVSNKGFFIVRVTENGVSTSIKVVNK